MLRTTRHVLKAHEVALEGQLHLGIEPVAQRQGTEPQSSSAAPTARVAQSHPDYAVIEVTCPCGKTTYIRCEYAQRSQ
jgi:hypothetical protein